MLELENIVVEKEWGTELWHDNNSKYCLKTLIAHAGKQLSCHSHAIKEETWVLTYGVLLIQFGTENDINQTFIAKPGYVVRISPGNHHRFTAITDIAVVVEASTEHLDSDSYRLPGKESGDFGGLETWCEY